MLDDHQLVYIQQSYHKAMGCMDFVVVGHVLVVVVYIEQMDLRPNLVDSCKVDCDLSLDILKIDKQN